MIIETVNLEWDFSMMLDQLFSCRDVLRPAPKALLDFLPGHKDAQIVHWDNPSDQL